jgi:hypothetical protein
MTLSDIAAFSTAVSGVTVTVSLIYLIIQTRQNVRHTRALIQQGASARTIAIQIATLAPQSMAAWLEGNGQEPSPEEVRKAQFFQMCQTSVTALEDIFAQHNDGLMQQEVFARNCAIHRGLLLEPGYRDYWDNYRTDLKEIAPKFTAFVDGLCVGEATEFGFRI